MQLEQLAVGEATVAVDQPDLVEPQPGLHADRERARNDLEVQPAAIAGGDLVEAVAAVGQHPREHVEAPGRALGVGLRADLLGEPQLLEQRHEIGPVALERGAVAQVDLFEGEILDLLLDGGVAVGQEAAAQDPRALAEAQVDAGRLDRLGHDSPVAGHDPFTRDRVAQALRGKNAPDAIGRLRPRAPARRLPRVCLSKPRSLVHRAPVYGGERPRPPRQWETWLAATHISK